MTIAEVKRIPIKDILSQMGIEPVMSRCGGTQLMYNSPLRKDKNASFSVSTRLNLWKDFGTQFAGNVIDLVIALKGNCSFREAVAWLKQQAGNPEDETSSPNTSRPQEHNASIMSGNSNMSDMRVKELSSPVLLKYLESRGIPAGIARRYCKEAHYTVRDREYYAIAFMNILGGMELRCQYFKGCHGVKAPSIVRADKAVRSPACCIFEGFMDFLSYKVLEESGSSTLVHRTACDCIILNSTSIIQRAVPFIDVYLYAYSFLDNDLSGKQAFSTINRLLPGRIHDMSNKYEPINDLNDYLVSGLR